MPPLLSSLRPSASNSNDSVLRELSKLSFDQAISVSFDLTKRSPSSAIRVEIMVQFGATCLHELSNRQTAVKLVNTVLKDIESKLSTLRKNPVDLSQSIVQPDLNLARKLNERGYSWNAARRACKMTGNHGYSEALGWAVAHFQDHDFNSPMYILNGDSYPNQNEDLSILLKKLLLTTRKSLIDATSLLHTVKTEPTAGASKTSSSETESTMLLPRDGQSSKKVEILSHHSSVPSRVSLPSIRTEVIRNSVAVKIQTPKNMSITRNDPPPNSADSVSSVGSLGSRTSINRQVNRGKVLGTQKLSMEERKKLAIEGRRLLEAARQRNTGVSAPPSSIVTKQHPRP